MEGTAKCAIEYRKLPRPLNDPVYNERIMGQSADHKPRQRESVFLLATVATPDGKSQRLRVRNLSPDGLCVEQPVALNKGAHVTISVGLIERAAAEVMWARNGFAGLKFAWPIDPVAARSRPAQSLDPKTGWGRSNL